MVPWYSHVRTQNRLGIEQEKRWTCFITKSFLVKELDIRFANNLLKDRNSSPPLLWTNTIVNVLEGLHDFVQGHKKQSRTRNDSYHKYGTALQPTSHSYRANSFIHTAQSTCFKTHTKSIFLPRFVNSNNSPALPVFVCTEERRRSLWSGSTQVTSSLNNQRLLNLYV